MKTMMMQSAGVAGDQDTELDQVRHSGSSLLMRASIQVTDIAPPVTIHMLSCQSRSFTASEVSEMLARCVSMMIRCFIHSTFLV